MIIALVSQKGGVGKSALARLIAVEYANAGWQVKIADLDTGQGSTTKWKSRRDQKGFKPEIPVEKYATAERAIRDSEAFDLMVLDGPAFAEKGGLKMSEAADLVIIPTGYSLDDMEPQVETAKDLEASGVSPEKIFFIFCRADGSTSEDTAARRYLQRAGMNVLKNIFPERPSVRQGHNNGLAASEVSHKTVRDKIIPLAAEIANLVVTNQPDTEKATKQTDTTAEPTEERKGNQTWATA